MCVPVVLHCELCNIKKYIYISVSIQNHTLYIHVKSRKQMQDYLSHSLFSTVQLTLQNHIYINSMLNIGVYAGVHVLCVR